MTEEGILKLILAILVVTWIGDKVLLRFGWGAFGSLGQRLKRVERKLDLTEHKLAVIQEHVGLDIDDSLFEIKWLLAEGQKIQAIKAYREQHAGMGLREAKEAVDEMEVEINEMTHKAGDFG